jgi:hypothetical protein
MVETGWKLFNKSQKLVENCSKNGWKLLKATVRAGEGDMLCYPYFFSSFSRCSFFFVCVSNQRHGNVKNRFFFLGQIALERGKNVEIWMTRAIVICLYDERLTILPCYVMRWLDSHHHSYDDRVYDHWFFLELRDAERSAFRLKDRNPCTVIR